jgi:hypothetical protein
VSMGMGVVHDKIPMLNRHDNTTAMFESRDWQHAQTPMLYSHHHKTSMFEVMDCCGGVRGQASRGRAHRGDTGDSPL